MTNQTWIRLQSEDAVGAQTVSAALYRAARAAARSDDTRELQRAAAYYAAVARARLWRLLEARR